MRRLIGFVALAVVLATVPPALAQDATPVGVSNEKTLAEVTLPADTLPLAMTSEVGLITQTVPAGTSVALTGNGGSCCQAQNLTYVLEGTSTFRSSGPTYLLSADNGTTPEVVTAATEVRLAPGDAILYRDEFDWEWTVTEDGPARLLSFWMIEGPSLPSSDLASWEVEDYEFIATDALPAEPLTLTLRDVTVDAGATLPPGPAIVQIAIASTTEGARLSTQSDYSVKNIAKEPVGLYVAALSPADPEAEVVVSGMGATPIATPTT